MIELAQKHSAPKQDCMTGNKRQGFTLIELLIVAALFSVAFLIATSVFVSVQKNQRAIAGRQRLVADGRYLLEAMARTVRLGTIDYRYYRDPDNNGDVTDELSLLSHQTILVTRDQTGQQTCFRVNGTTLETTGGGTNCNGSWTRVTNTDTQVKIFQVVILPASDPYLGPRTSSLDCKAGTPTSNGTCTCDDAADGNVDEKDAVNCLADQRCVATTSGQDICLNTNRQPTVTIVLETESTNTLAGEQASASLQTTVASRVIQR